MKRAGLSRLIMDRSNPNQYIYEGNSQEGKGLNLRQLPGAFV